MSANYKEIVPGIVKKIKDNLSKNLTHRGKLREENGAYRPEQLFTEKKCIKIYSDYTLTLPHDCSMHHCRDWAHGTGIIYLKLEGHNYIEYECPRDGVYTSWNRDLKDLLEAILSDDRNFDIIEN